MGDSATTVGGDWGELGAKGLRTAVHEKKNKKKTAAEIKKGVLFSSRLPLKQRFNHEFGVEIRI